MSPALTLDRTESPDSAVDDGEFELDMRVVESTTRLVIMMCDTSDGCGNTCSTSACSTGSNNPF
jgi:FxLD family lantipeptide